MRSEMSLSGPEEQASEGPFCFAPGPADSGLILSM